MDAPGGEMFHSRSTVAFASKIEKENANKHRLGINSMHKALNHSHLALAVEQDPKKHEKLLHEYLQQNGHLILNKRSL
jgi:hypothetical protein